ncbi:TadE/TadG family type IV pilus assembly protein [Arthrobacter sp. NEB 688]|uniref:TadE/TadG family type IV pilus assembly protein n=1 Tax=Arthrobacter sp. NEB 688 TaxID=904039 RepID=UPI001563F8B7|nr:TadE/TadG family type IV pilus assembly protein [Arthrobacter sp. NEB 688]QKE85513.1 hypothetical protein HL663_17325 [Arthrobacter sp. NEB 688]
MARPRLRLVRGCPVPADGVRDERGAVALEAAIVFLFLFSMLAGVIDLSMYFKDSYSVSTAARAGARMAAADPLNATFTRSAATQAASAMTDLRWQDVKEIWVYKANVGTTSVLVTPLACGVNCVKFTLTGPGTPSAGSGVWLSRNACSSGLVAVDSVGVRVVYQHKATVMFANNALITEDVVMRLEQIPSTQPCIGTGS